MPLVAEDFTWEFIFDTNSAWPLAHMYNPFILQILVQRWWFTLLVVWAWESVEILAVTIFQGQYVIFVGDDSEIEPITDTLVGDIFQGILGILLGYLVVFAWRIPKWAPSFTGPKRDLAFKKLLQYVFWVVPLSLTNMQIRVEGAYTVNIGVVIIAITNVFFILTWYYTDYSPLAVKLYWYKYTRDQYQFVYTGILVNTCVLLLGSSIHWWYSYFQTWISLAALVVINLFVIVAYGRVVELTKHVNNKIIYP